MEGSGSGESKQQRTSPIAEFDSDRELRDTDEENDDDADIARSKDRASKQKNRYRIEEIDDLKDTDEENEKREQEEDDDEEQEEEDEEDFEVQGNDEEEDIYDEEDDQEEDDDQEEVIDLTSVHDTLSQASQSLIFDVLDSDDDDQEYQADPAPYEDDDDDDVVAVEAPPRSRNNPKSRRQDSEVTLRPRSGSSHLTRAPEALGDDEDISEFEDEELDAETARFAFPEFEHFKVRKAPASHARLALPCLVLVLVELTRRWPLSLCPAGVICMQSVKLLEAQGTSSIHFRTMIQDPRKVASLLKRSLPLRLS